ncbi:uncharacterized protein CLAFUR5_10456 [Fulvia fulva]|uniref:Uncharacterized protein n=1 Tax=Passalora fulva TaxID=5499 RepID=A0A9Q8PCJ0_PASFU|nr:uncharacterized protein CLAFUR5_10456 [Fulvia fulva]UJO19892.1 hypothetical protein CLAFUR5_10456 [Fulvia fulva]
MPCGMHRRPANVPAKPLDYYDRPRKSAQRYRRVLKQGEKRGDCSCDYHDYPQLRFESEHAEETFKDKPFRFAGLPTAIRKQILGEAVLFDGVIEFCPEPFQWSGYGRQKGCEEEFREACSHQYDTVKPKVYTSWALMRTCKQFKEDITEDFYSSNEFRFSNVTGWVTLDILLQKIGSEKAAMIRKLSVSHPGLNVLPESLSTLGTYAGAQIYISMIGDIRSEPGFDTYSDKRWFESGKAILDPVLVLEKIGKLRELRWIIPAFSRHGVVPYMESPVDQNKFENLTMTWAGVHTKQEYTFDTYNDPRVLMYSAQHKAKEFAEAHTEKTNKICKYEDHWLDENGEWVDSVVGESQWVNEGIYDGIEALFAEE